MQNEVLTTGELIRGSFVVLRDNVRTVLIYLGVVIGAETLPDLNPYEDFEGLIALGILAVFFVAQYLMFEAMLRNARLLPIDARRRFFRFVGQAFVVLFGVLLATNLFVIPAVIVGARWIMAPCLLVSGRCGAIDSLGESWTDTKGNTAPIAFAACALMTVGYGAVMVIDGASGAVATLFGGSKMFGGVLLVGLNLALVCLSVAVFRRLNGDTHELAEVFA